MVEEQQIKNRKSSFDKEIKYIKLSKHLKRYETDLKSIFKEKNYYKIIINGTIITELMLECTLNENNNPNKPTSMIKCTIKTNDIPFKIKNALFEIDRINREINEEKVNYKKTYKFLKSFEKFISEFHCIDDETLNINTDNCIKLINSLPKTEPAENNRNEEKEYIDRINNSLKNLEKHLEIISKENYVGAVIQSYEVCNSMLELFLKNEKFIIDEGLVIQDDEKKAIIPFCIQNDLFPKECGEFLNIMEEYYYNLFQLNNSYDLALSFLEGTSYFISWFNNFYSDKYSIDKPFKIENCIFAIYKVLANSQNDDGIVFKANSSKIKKQKTEIENNNFQIPFSNKNISNQDLQQILSVVTQDIKNHVSEEIGNVMDELNDIKKEIKNISLKITDYQSLLKKQLNSFDTEEEKDKLIAAFADECAERILNQSDSFREDDSYNSEKTNLIKLLGDDAWAKLSEESKTCLISSKIMFNNIGNMDENLDYSGVCILVTKTLEVEMFKRFYENFFEYLNKNYHHNYQKYPTGLLYKNKWPLDPEKFNLGTISYIFCLKEDKSIDYFQEQNNKKKLIEYCEENVFKGYDSSEIERLIEKYGTELDEIREKYRNPSAHRDKIQKCHAEKCFDKVLYDDELLKEMLESFNE